MEKINVTEQLERAHQLLTSGKDLETANSIFNAILNLDPTSPTLLFYIACVQMRLGFNQLAIILFNESLKLDNDSIKASFTYNNLGYVYKLEVQIEKAMQAFSKAHELNPNEADFLSNLGSVYVANGTPDIAIENFEKALKLKADDDNTHWNYGLALLEKGDYENGFREYDHGHRTQEKKERFYINDNLPPFWDGTKGQTVIVYGEQGIGDEIMFASMLIDMMNDCNVILDAHPRLADIFRRSFPQIPVYGTRKDNQCHWPKFHKQIDAKIAIASLGKFYRKSEDDFKKCFDKPYLVADLNLKEKYKKILQNLGDKPKIGISWKGGTKQTGLKDRTIRLEQFVPIFDYIDADFISLQYTENAQKEIDEFNQKYEYKIHHWQDMVDDYDETAALVSNLDLIISVPQSVVHLAGAIGIQTIQLTPKKAMWQMGVYGKDMPWYSSVINIWQDDTHTWEPVIEKTKDFLCSLSQKNTEN